MKEISTLIENIIYYYVEEISRKHGITKQEAIVRLEEALQKEDVNDLILELA